ncbi:DUF6233 domain-containing protein [Streptomyces sp. NPDC048295]|uniref:DUF6233 domain-containing protein n=1 Tax=Streptomyces sp. NPDC048295 TaxID=3154617 RepID=UPI0034233188
MTTSRTLCRGRGLAAPGADGIPDLDKNRALEQWLEWWQLRQVRGRIRELEIRERQEGRERARAEQSRKIQPQRSGRTALLHRGGCGLYNAALGFLDREEALIALAEPDIEPCEVCRPEAGLVQA